MCWSLFQMNLACCDSANLGSTLLHCRSIGRLIARVVFGSKTDLITWFDRPSNLSICGRISKTTRSELTCERASLQCIHLAPRDDSSQGEAVPLAEREEYTIYSSESSRLRQSPARSSASGALGYPSAGTGLVLAELARCRAATFPCSRRGSWLKLRFLV